MANKKGFKMSDVPPEVIEVWVIQHSGQPVGQVLYDKCMETIKKYPNWFQGKEEVNQRNKY